MDNYVAVGLLLVGGVSLAFGIEWLFLGAVLVFIAMAFSERIAPQAPASAGNDFAFQQPVIVQSALQNATHPFYADLINNIVQNVVQNDALVSEQKGLIAGQNKKIGELFKAQDEKIVHVSKQVHRVREKVDGLS